MTVKLLRVESLSGVGMYHSGLFYNATGMCSNDDYNHPAPFEDYLLKRWFYSHDNTKEFLYCFSTKKQFLQWVYSPEWRHKLVELGAVLVVVEVDDSNCIIGDKQSVYRKDSVLSCKIFPVNSFDIPALAVEINDYINS